ncbi:PREDICTED: zinc finger and BTB domain-containing protein 49 [Rhagoletis zephyria]|uniref:zinc finger and BTB domain-containing protein 49 n=1 Tax=Rhagoletis zephyria TaxID=28612 RepID=UPI00081172F3|nr:PREDICTED: zinc finger and BTB domain-containing protein 49 [Rhagoletis zephyria]
MEIELNIRNLRNLCRICLGVPDYNLWEQKVCWANEATTNDGDTSDQNAEDITVREVLQMYNDWQHSILEMDDELQLICKQCLNELQPHYRYYRRLLAANRQMKQLYEEALEKEVVTNQVIIENIALEDNLPEFMDVATEYPTQQDSSTQHEMYTISSLPLKQAQKRKFVKSPKFILTGGVTQLLAHATGATSFASSVAANDPPRQANPFCSPQKRKRLDLDVELPAPDKKVNSDSLSERQPYPKNQVMVANHEISENHENRAIVTSVEVVQESPKTEISTYEYSPNEQVQEFVTSHNDDNPLKIENDEQAVLPFSTVSADHAGRSIYVCKYCPQAFTAPCFLLTHARKSHVCKYCSKGFIKTPDLFAHVKQAHQEHKCGICDKEFSTNGNLRAHIRRVHRSKTPESTPRLISKYAASECVGIMKEDFGDGAAETIYIEETSQPMKAEYLD